MQQRPSGRVIGIMENRSHALAAGLFTVLMFLGVALSVWWLGGNHQDATELQLIAKGRVDGLSTQSQVRFRGMRVGKVLRIKIEDDEPYRILVTVQVAKTVPLSQATRAELALVGVTGLAFVQLDERGPERGPLPVGVDGLPYLDLAPSSIETITKSATGVMAQLSEVLTKVNQLLTADTLNRLERTIAHVERMSAQAERSTQYLPEVLNATRSLLAPDNLAHFKSALAQIDHASGELRPLLTQAQGSLKQMDILSRRLNTLTQDTGQDLGENLPRVQRLIREATSNAKELSRTLDELRRAPQSLLYGRPTPLPGPGEAGYAE